MHWTHLSFSVHGNSKMSTHLRIFINSFPKKDILGPGRGGTASLKVTTYCQTNTSEFSLTAPYFWEFEVTAL